MRGPISRPRSQLKHGLSHTPEYRAWQTARHRCTNPASPAWDAYGGRGIRMSDEWLESPQAFIDHVGPRPSPRHEIDRERNDGHYEPGNVRWVIRPVNCRNRRSTRVLEHNGERLSVVEWAERSGLSATVILHRLDTGWTIAEAITKPVRTLSPKGVKKIITSPCIECAVRPTRGLRCKSCENRNRARVRKAAAAGVAT